MPNWSRTFAASIIVSRSLSLPISIATVLVLSFISLPVGRYLLGCPERDVAPVMGILEPYLLRGRVRARPRVFERGRPRGHPEHAPPRGDDPPLPVLRGAGVEDRHAFDRAGFVEP